MECTNMGPNRKLDAFKLQLINDPTDLYLDKTLRSYHSGRCPMATSAHERELQAEKLPRLS